MLISSIPLMASAGLMATVSATFPVNPALRARSCGVDPSDPMSPSRSRLLSTSSVCHCAASCSCGLTLRVVLGQPALRCIVYTLDTTLLLSRELFGMSVLSLSACAAGIVSTVAALSSTVAVEAVHAACRVWIISVPFLRSSRGRPIVRGRLAQLPNLGGAQFVDCLIDQV